MRDRRLERRLAESERLRGDGDASAVERPHGDLESVAGCAEQVIAVRPRTSVNSRSMQPSPRTPSESASTTRVRPGVSSGTRKALTPRPRTAGLRGGEDDCDIGRLGVGHPHLSTVQHIASLVEPGGRLLVGGIGSRPLFRKRKRADRIA